MKIAVLGSGNGGCAVAFDWAFPGKNFKKEGLRTVSSLGITRDLLELDIISFKNNDKEK